jgi:Family of unknown function (DUF5829)
MQVLAAVTFMRINVLLTIVLVACFGRVNSQITDPVKVVISHVFFCVDSVTYQNLFEHEFIAKLFANTSEYSSKTTTDSWTGKYLNGRQSYIEVFASDDKKIHPQLGDKFGDVGLVFRTKRPGDIQKIDARIKADKHDAQLDLMKYESDKKIIPFNYNLYLSEDALQETFRPYVEEFTMDFLKLCGFSESEIKGGITEEQFREKRRGKKYEKLFDNIEKIELILTSKEFAYLAETLKYVGFSQTGHRFTSNGLEILCSVQQNRKYKLKAIHFTLLNESESITIKISKNLTFSASGTKALFQFNYE